MSHRRIKSAVHNMLHSFLSLTNYVDDGYVVDDLQERLRRLEERITINFTTGAIEPAAAATPRILKSVEYYRAGLNSRLRSEQVAPEAVREVVLRLQLTSSGYDHAAEVTDDRGDRYAFAIRPT